MLFQLLAELFLSLDQTDMIELLLISALPRQISSPVEAFEPISELEQRRHTSREEDWPKYILEKLAIETINESGIRLAQGVVDAPMLIPTEYSLVPQYNQEVEFRAGHPWGNQIIQ